MRWKLKEWRIPGFQLANLPRPCLRPRRDRAATEPICVRPGRPLRRAGTHRQSAGDAGKLVAFQKIESGCEGGIELDSTSFDLPSLYRAPAVVIFGVALR